MPVITQLGTLNDIVSQAAMEIGIAQAPVSTVVNTHDQDVRQMQALLSAVAAEVLSEEPYQTTLGDGYWIADSDGTPIPEWSSDSNLVLFDRRLAVAGVKWRFLAAKGLEYAEAMRDFTTRLNKLAVEANAKVLDLDVDWSRVQ